MTELRLVSHAEDGSGLVFADDAGTEYRVPVTDDLRQALRRAKIAAASQAPPAPETDQPTLSPREIQRRIRSGLTATELSELTGVPVSALEPFEGPVAAEREYVATVARSTRIGRDATAPQLGDLVADRLASRGVDSESIAWDAYRDDGAPWSVVVDFTVGERNLRAAWHYDHVGKTVTAQDEEAAWLSETELLDVPIPRRHLTAVDVTANDAPLEVVRPASPAPSSSLATENLLEELDAQRGQRQDLDLDADDEDFEGFGPTSREAPVSFIPPTSPPHPAGRARSSEPAPAPERDDDDKEPTKKPKRGRASVPSWDEIVFGAKNSSD